VIFFRLLWLTTWSPPQWRFRLYCAIQCQLVACLGLVCCELYCDLCCVRCVVCIANLRLDVIYWRPGDLATWRPHWRPGDLLATGGCQQTHCGAGYFRTLLATHLATTGYHWRPGGYVPRRGAACGGRKTGRRKTGRLSKMGRKTGRWKDGKTEDGKTDSDGSGRDHKGEDGNTGRTDGFSYHLCVTCSSSPMW
jgi:hypothetical protein